MNVLFLQVYYKNSDMESLYLFFYLSSEMISNWNTAWIFIKFIIYQTKLHFNSTSHKIWRRHHSLYNRSSIERINVIVGYSRVKSTPRTLIPHVILYNAVFQHIDINLITNRVICAVLPWIIHRGQRTPMVLIFLL